MTTIQNLPTIYPNFDLDFIPDSNLDSNPDSKPDSKPDSNQDFNVLPIQGKSDVSSSPLTSNVMILVALGAFAFLFVIAILLLAWFDFWSICIEKEKKSREIKIGDLESQSGLMPSAVLTPKSRSPDSEQKFKSSILRKRTTPTISNPKKERSHGSQNGSKTANHKKIIVVKHSKSFSRSITFSGLELEQNTDLHWDFKPLS